MKAGMWEVMDYNFLNVPILSFILAFTLFPLVHLLLSRNTKKLLPPGPSPLPIIGNLHLLDASKPHKSLAKLSQKYGPIMSLKLGQVPTIVISSPSIAKEVLQKQDLACSSRYVKSAGQALNHHQHSVIWLPVATRWRFYRKILNSNFFSNTRLDANEHLRSKKVDELIDYCKRKSNSGEAVNISAAVFTTFSNLMSNMIFSKDLTDPFNLESHDEFKKLIHDSMEVIGKTNIVDSFPMLQKIDPQGIKRRMEYLLNEFRIFFGRLIDERLEEMKSECCIEYNDILDILLRSSDDHEDAQEFDKDHIWHSCVDLFAAGIDTISSTIEWAMSELLKNPEAMERSKEELTQMERKSTQLKEADFAGLPYLSSILKETLRLHPPAPLLVPRKVEQSIEICGYTIPKNSQIFVNVWAIGRDPTIWEHGSKFRPEFFLQSEIEFRGRNFELLPFGAGRRICPGLSLAAKMLPIVLGSLLKSFEWKLEGDIAPHELEMNETFGITMTKTHPLKAIPIS